MNTEIMTWLERAKMWAMLFTVGANKPSHPAHESSFVPLQQWLIDNRPERLGLLLQKEMTND